MRILVFGDSIAQGFWDSEGGWVARLRKHYDQQRLSGEAKDPPAFFNLGISGDTTKMVLVRLKPETEARQFPGEEYAFIFQTGSNDAVYRGTEHESEPDMYARQLADIVATARKFSSKILFVGLTPAVDELVQPVRWSTSGKCYSTERQALFDKALKDFCAKNNLPVTDMFTSFSKASDLKELLPDGLHPNDEGHKLMAGLILPELEKLLRD